MNRRYLIILIIILGFTVPISSQAHDFDITTTSGTFDITNFAVMDWVSSQNVSVSLSATNSDVAMSSLLSYNTDAVVMARNPTSAELEQAQSQGMDLRITIFALETLVVIVHPDNPIESLNAIVIQKIFTAAIRDWLDVGWPSFSSDIHIFEHFDPSASQQFFHNYFLSDQLIPAGLLAEYHNRYSSQAQLVNVLNNNIGGIGFVQREYLTSEVKALRINGIGHNDLSYPLIRPVYMVYDYNSANEDLKEFSTYIQSPDNQQNLESEGYRSCDYFCGILSAPDLEIIIDEQESVRIAAFQYTGAVETDPNYEIGGRGPTTSPSTSPNSNMETGTALIFVIGIIVAFVIYFKRSAIASKVQFSPKRTKTITTKQNEMPVARLEKVIQERRCCVLSGRLGDSYCNICGRHVPYEFQLKQVQE